MTNLNLLFNKTYYAEIERIFWKVKDTDEKSFSKCLERHNNNIYNSVFVHERDYKPSEVSGENGSNTNDKGKKLGTFLLKTVYPGLLIGAGNPHGSRQSDNDINLGFSFDYVSGQPFIPGSSVKGVLRSKFKQSPVIIAEILENILDTPLGEDKVGTVKALETDIFDGKDVFLDAVVYDGEPVYGRLMGGDYITPHSSPIKNPIPVLFIKVLPEVRFEFRFKLNDAVIDGVKITAAKKKHLFMKLLMFFGVGAKTNVGYGIFDECGSDIHPKTPLTARNETVARPRPAQTSTSSAEFKECKTCGKRIYKHKKNGSDNPRWRYDNCYDCAMKARR